ncbi:MAG: hypothetical protein HC874_30410 [Richelia sp. SL_2_1]|nr:hypothetical protein [Richelia sp. SL_2_1]
MENKKEIIKKAKVLLDTRIKTLADVKDWIDYLVLDELKDYDTNLLLKHFNITDTIDILNNIKTFLSMSDVYGLSNYISHLKVTYNVKRGYIMWPLRVAISGKKVALPLFESIEIIGKDKTINRINVAIRKLENHNGAK